MKVRWTVSLGAGLMFLGMAVLTMADDKPKQNSPTDSQKTPSAVSKTSTTATAEFPLIGYLEKRGQTIIIKSGPKGPLYSVKTADGKVLFEDVPAEQLQAKAPELHQFIKSAVAGPARMEARVKENSSPTLRIPSAGERIKIDARIDATR